MQSDNDGWRSLLAALGFRFEKAHNNLADSVFFPTQEYLNVLNTGSNTLYAFLGKMFLCVCVYARARACVHACVRVVVWQGRRYRVGYPSKMTKPFILKL